MLLEGGDLPAREVLVWEPGRHYAQSFTLAQDPAYPSRLDVTFEEAKHVGGTRVRFAHGGWTPANVGRAGSANGTCCSASTRRWPTPGPELHGVVTVPRAPPPWRTASRRGRRTDLAGPATRHAVRARTMRPSSTTSIWSAPRIVDSRWAMTSDVRRQVPRRGRVGRRPPTPSRGERWPHRGRSPEDP